jgi:glycosyltransferase involved in cell wall biosynthesis
MQPVRVAAVMVMRNERAYVRNCLRHLIDNGVDFYVIDNESADDTREILAAPEIAPHLIGLETYPFDGSFDWAGLMQARERAARAVDADWILFVSADEMMHSYRPGETLSAAIARIALDGWDVIDFNEFVFLPVGADYVSDRAGLPPLQHYYFFEPHKPRLMRARRADLDVSHLAAGGHTFAGEFRLAPESMALRHYIVRDQAHAFRKYRERLFRADEVERGWHRSRVGQAHAAFALPPPTALHRLDRPESRALDRSAPRATHYWQWDSSS